MVDYIRDEEEQVERIKAWWQENGTAAVITVVLAVAALIGWRQWQGHQGEQAAEASTEYQVMLEALSANPMDKAVINDKADLLIEDFGSSAYADYARLAKASLAVQDGDYDSAVSLLQPVADDGATDALSYTASLRLARVFLQQQAWDKADAQLSGRFPDAFNGMALELRGDLAKAQGEAEQARDLYAQALDVLQDGGEKDRVQMKLDDLKSAS
ncbi:tetratricopeptide repeat protein [uncultured Alcanivorax sp.]|uniref:YfgM family protein n=1 Tax=uncultured Alcanivorax sp. TaxID=191215 RepID=UPI00260FE806|nr:tetratricopeptide repeat protein [uncultured Alcanivorax sp.]